LRCAYGGIGAISELNTTSERFDGGTSLQVANALSFGGCVIVHGSSSQPGRQETQLDPQHVSTIASSGLQSAAGLRMGRISLENDLDDLRLVNNQLT
jgi:hypothetical protein